MTVGRIGPERSPCDGMHLDHQLTAELVAEIAARHGLRIDDALALRLLADDIDEAERIAALFERQGDAA